MRLAAFIRRNRGTIAVIAFSVAVLLIIVGLFRIDNSTNEKIVEYMNDLGWEVEDSPSEITHLTIPEEFDAVYQAYNAVQKASGFDLEEYRGKKVTRYSYRVLNHKSSEDSAVVAGIFVYKDSIIAGDISADGEDGFMHSVTDSSYIAD